VVECQFQPLELHLAVKNAQNMPYIPGSSIKGALRTALCYNLLFTSPKSMQLLKRRIYKVLFRRNAEKFLRNIVESFFGSVKGRHSPHYDVMKFLRISDSSSLLQEKLIVREVSMIETRGYVAQRKTGLRTHVEVIKPGTTLYGKITLDKTIVKEGYSRYAMDFPMLNIITNLKIITSYANKFASDLIDHEIEFSETYGFSGLKHFYMNLKQNILQKLDEGQFLLRVGWGSGYLATTIGLLLKKEHDLFRDIRRRFKLGDRRAPTFPLSRKVILEDNDMIPLGWVKFTVMD
jgi:CRISPR-associated protein Csm5